MAQKDDVDIAKGDTWERTLEFTKGDGDPQDIGGWTIYAAIKDERGDSAALSKTVTSHDDENAGLTSIGFTSAETQGLETKSYFYDIRFKTDTGLVDTLVEGVFTVDEPVSTV